MSKTLCVRCGDTLDTATESGWEFLHRFIFDNSPNCDDAVCHGCIELGEAELVGFLVTEGYDSLWEWAWDSNYALFADGMWRDDSGAMVDVAGMAFAAMEVSQ